MFFGWKVIQRDDDLTTPRLVLVTAVGDIWMQLFLPNEGKGRWECSLSGQDELSLPRLNHMWWLQKEQRLWKVSF